ncbi:MAG: hypothetical protein JWR61_1558 [Ferruginibacter sp.]|uniref:hypothetical protein n=1 Tax=Ferruginibacter sp. TaxID=1940288 RepID=UPI002659010E|nr:hypothetical protein [Ferruginibacter sp.]MDB5276603.1 hypothetical protein [Ferruginibacter sp.]
MTKLLLLGMLFLSLSCHAQELFSMTEPASNMAAGSIGFRIDNSIMDETNSSKINYHLIPEIRIGVLKKLMINANAFFSNRTKQLKREGGSIYAKYRFLSNDAVQKHFRVAAFGTMSFNNSDIHQQEINMYGHNTGFEAGMVVTQLLHKVALSSSISLAKAVDNGNNNKYVYGTKNNKAINYSLSIGKLMLPKEYSNYHQTNINLMVETLSQVNTGSGKYYLDIAPSIQLIFNSESRIDIGYRKQVSSSLLRTAPNGFFIRLEHNFFNAF